MEKIKLSKDEKKVLRLLNGGCGCPDAYPWHVFAACVDSLERKGLAKGAWASGHVLVDARLTSNGEAYLALNPGLRNPVDWQMVAVAVSVVGLAVSIVAMFVACSK